MEVTRKNFNDVLPQVTESIKNADFMAIDCEFTGLHNGITENLFDTPEERYEKLRKGSTDFLIIQFGLCTFSLDSEKKKYKSHPYNFYVFPRPLSHQAPDTRFLCQASSMDFLANQGFDFNKVFKEGIPYLTPNDEQTLRKAMEQKHKKFMDLTLSPSFTSPTGQDDAGPTKGPAAVPDDQKQYVEDTLKLIEDFLENKDQESLDLPKSSAFQRKLIYQTAKMKFQNNIALETKARENKERYILVSRVSSEDELRQKQIDRQNEDLKKLDDEVGFCKVIKMISESGKTVVGHNMLLDLIHTLHQFCGPLPESYEDFKTMTNCIFPRLIDTKVMGTTQPFKEQMSTTVLGDMRKILETKPFLKPATELPEEFSSYSQEDAKLHEAGYDAYITGTCFLTLSNYLGKFQDPPTDSVPTSSELLEPFVNKIYLMRVYDIPYINLAGQDVSSTREHVFHVTFPSEWNRSDLQNLFTAFAPITIGWLDEMSAYVAIYKRDSANQVIRSIPDNTLYKVTTYASHKKLKTPSRKRPLKEDEHLITKPGTEAKLSRSSLESIPEEMEQDDKQKDDIEEDIGEPVKKKKRKSEKNGNNGKEDKMFQEPTW